MKILFFPYTDFAGNTGKKPLPAKKMLPKWFTKMPQFENNSKKFKLFPFNQTNATVKWCNPFLDSLTAGYVISLEYDVQVSIEEDGPSFLWNSGGELLVSSHSKNQIPIELIPEGYCNQAFKFRNDWAIKTPKGYSALFVHPLNRTDLPFITLSGFVDTDDYNMPVNFPFILKADFEGIIPAGTPIAQIIPIKRESWNISINEFSLENIKNFSSKFRATIFRAYKNLFWKRKDYN